MSISMMFKKLQMAMFIVVLIFLQTIFGCLNTASISPIKPCNKCSHNLLPSPCPFFNDCNKCAPTALMFSENGCLSATVSCPSTSQFVYVKFTNGTGMQKPVADIVSIRCTNTAAWSLILKTGTLLITSITCIQVGNGIQQSPVDIKTSTLIYNTYLTTIQTNYAPYDGDTLAWGHDVHGFQVASSGNHDLSTFYASQTDGELYSLQQMHMHWGDPASMLGSEHTVDGRRFNGELHFVHYNRARYGTFTNSVGQPNGLAVTAVFVEIGAENTEFDKVINIIKANDPEGSATGIMFDYNQFLPATQTFFTYTGSLTTADFNTCVLWTIFTTPITFSQEQFNVLYTVLNDNFRDVQPVETPIYSNFNPFPRVQSFNFFRESKKNVTDICDKPCIFDKYTWPIY